MASFPVRSIKMNDPIVMLCSLGCKYKLPSVRLYYIILYYIIFIKHEVNMSRYLLKCKTEALSFIDIRYVGIFTKETHIFIYCVVHISVRV